MRNLNNLKGDNHTRQGQEYQKRHGVKSNDGTDNGHERGDHSLLRGRL
jgi:hypothetical protein